MSSKSAQQPDFGLRKPSAYHWDLLLLAVVTLACGLLGVPPINGVIPQAPMHTRSLALVQLASGRNIAEGGVELKQQRDEDKLDDNDQRVVVVDADTNAMDADDEGSLGGDKVVETHSLTLGVQLERGDKDEVLPEKDGYGGGIVDKAPGWMGGAAVNMEHCPADVNGTCFSLYCNA